MNGLGFLLIVVAFGFLWLVMVRPQKRRQSEQQRMLKELKIGDQVLTAGGVYGEITALREDEVVVEIAPQVQVRVSRRAVAGVVAQGEPVEPDEVVEPDDDADPTAGEEHG